jgi:hypothetical protein
MNEPFYFYFLKRNKWRQIKAFNNKKWKNYLHDNYKPFEWYYADETTTHYNFKTQQWDVVLKVYYFIFFITYNTVNYNTKIQFYRVVSESGGWAGGGCVYV